MKYLIAILLLASCEGEILTTKLHREPYNPGATPIEEPYCGDGICSPGLGETKYDCIDCGLNPFTGCPIDGGMCGDGICCGTETMRECFEDCAPIAINPDVNILDPGYIDPPRRN